MFPVVAPISIPASVSVGATITNPQPITGAWEQRTAQGNVVGFDIAISTDVPGTPKSLSGVTQRVAQVWIITYVRTDQRSQRTFGITGQNSTTLNWQSNHLVFHQPAKWSAKPVDLDLTFDPTTSTWHGTLQNEWFSGTVSLQRPFVQHVGFSIIGDWIANNSHDQFGCLHIALGVDSALVIWSDNIELLGFLNYGNRATPPPTTPEWYGDLDMDQEMKDIGTNLLFFTGSNMSGDIVLGHVSTDGTTFAGSSAHFGNGISNGAFNPFTWQRSSSDCAA